MIPTGVRQDLRTGHRRAGFSLIELLLALALLALITTVAWPTYNHQLLRSRRTDCMAVLLGLAQAMEHFYALHYSYSGAAAGEAASGVPASSLYPAQCPLNGSAHYLLSIEAASTTGYTLRATPTAASPQRDNGWLELDALGQRRWDRDNDGSATGPAERHWGD